MSIEFDSVRSLYDTCYVNSLPTLITNKLIIRWLEWKSTSLQRDIFSLIFAGMFSVDLRRRLISECDFLLSQVDDACVYTRSDLQEIKNCVMEQSTIVYSVTEEKCIDKPDYIIDRRLTYASIQSLIYETILKMDIQMWIVGMNIDIDQYIHDAVTSAINAYGINKYKQCNLADKLYELIEEDINLSRKR